MIRRPPRSTLFPCPPLSRSAPPAPPGAATPPRCAAPAPAPRTAAATAGRACSSAPSALARRPSGGADRSEEHTSELQSRHYLVCRLLLEKNNTLALDPATLV